MDHLKQTTSDTLPRLARLGMLFAFAAVAAITVGACGGGGSVASSPPTLVPNPPPPAPPPVVGTATLRPYAPGSGAALAQAALNAALTQCGLPAMQAVKELDDAAAAHGNYVRLNGASEIHNQTAGKPGFTGVDPTAQARAAGYVQLGSVGQVAYLGPLPASVDQALGAVLFAFGPYHQLAVTGGYNVMGYAFDPAFGLYINFAAFNLPAFTRVNQDGIAPFPCTGSTNVPTGFGQENPNPGTRSQVDQQFNPYGPGLNFRAAIPTDVLVVTRVDVRVAGTTELIPTEKARTETEIGSFALMQAFMPIKQLEKLTSYEAVVQYTLNGATRQTVVRWRTGAN